MNEKDLFYILQEVSDESFVLQAFKRKLPFRPNVFLTESRDRYM